MAVCLLVLTMGCACAVAHAGQGDVHLGTFDESEGTLADDVTGNQPGVVHAAQWVQGRIGSGLKLDGIDDYAALPDNDPLWNWPSGGHGERPPAGSVPVRAYLPGRGR